MELNIENFTTGGNNLLWRNKWNELQRRNCRSKSSVILQNKNHYDRILYSLTDSKSINVLNNKSISSLTKMTEDEFITKYVQEFSGLKDPNEMASAIHLSYPDSESEDSSSYTTDDVYDSDLQSALSGYDTEYDTDNNLVIY